MNRGELFVVKWQYRLHGTFFTHLANAIARADEDNLDRLKRGFPDEVNGYVNYKAMKGWWETTRQKAIDEGVLRPDIGD